MLSLIELAKEESWKKQVPSPSYQLRLTGLAQKRWMFTRFR